MDAVTDEKVAAYSIACWGTFDDLAERTQLFGRAEPFESVLLGFGILEENVAHGAAGFDPEGVDLILLRRDVDQRMREERSRFVKLGRVRRVGKTVDVAQDCHHGFWVIFEEIELIRLILLIRSQYEATITSL